MLMADPGCGPMWDDLRGTWSTRWPPQALHCSLQGLGMCRQGLDHLQLPAFPRCNTRHFWTLLLKSVDLHSLFYIGEFEILNCWPQGGTWGNSEGAE